MFKSESVREHDEPGSARAHAAPYWIQEDALEGFITCTVLVFVLAWLSVHAYASPISAPPPSCIGAPHPGPGAGERGRGGADCRALGGTWQGARGPHPDSQDSGWAAGVKTFSLLELFFFLNCCVCVCVCLCLGSCMDVCVLE